MRGALVVMREIVLKIGIIPADAGSTVVLVYRGDPTRDHPRGCGEHHLGGLCLCLNVGSSPRMRGARIGNAEERYCLRIIPADAGSTPMKNLGRSGARDHPRGCGEHYLDRWHDRFDLGSSPRMRGARSSNAPSPPGRGIIPADAGSTW